MKVALASVKFINKDLEFNLLQIKKHMIKAKEENAALVCFGESFLQGFDALVWNYEIDKNMAISQNSEIMNTIKEFTTSIGIDLLIGYIEKENETIFSSYALISNGKILHNHRRTAKGWKEFTKTDFHYQEGTNVEIINYKGKNIVLALCGELWDFPDRFKLSQDLLIWGVYCNYSETEWETEEIEYAEFAGTICDKVMLINSISKNPDCLGGAWLIDKGKIESKSPLKEENVLVVEL